MFSLKKQLWKMFSTSSWELFLGLILVGIFATALTLESECGLAGLPENGILHFQKDIIDPGDIFPVGYQVTYECQAGWKLVGDEQRTCQDSGRWSGSVPLCVSEQVTGGNVEIASPEDTLSFIAVPNWNNPPRIPCGRPDAPARGIIKYMRGKNGAIYATHECTNGFTIHGDNIRICSHVKEWTGIQPDCIRIEELDPVNELGIDSDNNEEDDDSPFGQWIYAKIKEILGVIRNLTRRVEQLEDNQTQYKINALESDFHRSKETIEKLNKKMGQLEQEMSAKDQPAPMELTDVKEANSIGPTISIVAIVFSTLVIVIACALYLYKLLKGKDNEKESTKTESFGPKSDTDPEKCPII